jgi:hypothetical protein
LRILLNLMEVTMTFLLNFLLEMATADPAITDIF